MSLKIIKLQPKLARFVLIAAAILCVAATWFFIRWNFANAVASRIDPRLAESKMIADWLTKLAPSDPQTHLTAAQIFEKTFDPGDLDKAVAEYEKAANLSPNDYIMWLNLGKARSISGDADGAHADYARALELAPKYASVQWVYGNSLIRRGNKDEGFAMIAKAAANNPEYATAAALTALQIFDGNLAQARRALGDSDATNAALAAASSGQNRYDEAFDAWSRITGGDKPTVFQKLGETLAGQMATANKFQLAARITADLKTNDSEKPVAGQIVGGGFENGVKLRNAGLFEWQIADGAQPQIGLGEGQAHGGKYSLWMMFNTFDPAAFRAVSQTVPVVAGGNYEFEVFYRSDLKTAAVFKWEVVDAANLTVMASTSPLVPAGDWTSLKMKFPVPAASDGIILRLAREGCAGASCPVNGKLSFDDLSIRQL